MGDSQLTVANTMNDIVRSIFSFLDRPAYWLLGLMYQLFFNVASADLFSNGTVLAFYKRVQLIIGVFMMFQLAVTILKGIMNPDSFTDSKSGAGNLIKRVAISLVLLTVLVPISLPNAKNEYERQINNNGLLFGTLYSLQHRLLSNNTLGRLVLGTDAGTESFTNSDLSSRDSNLARSSRIFTATILKGFYRINLIPEDKRVSAGDGKQDDMNPENWVCKDLPEDVKKIYTRVDADAGEIIDAVTADCEIDDADLNLFQSAVALWSPKLAGKTRYALAYMPFVSAIVGVIFVFILLSFTVDVAVRAVKLAVLRLIAPIPIIMYMNPKGGDTAFNAWTKTLSTTYLDLFIRLASVYFVIFLVQDMMENGIYINNASGVLGTISFILILIGLFVFAKEAPKFIKQILGFKDEGGKLFGGLGTLAAAGATALGTIGSGIASAKASKLADETRQGLGQDVNPNGFLNRAKHIAAGIAGGVAGGAAGAKAGFSAKDHAFRSSLDAMQKRNANAITRGASGSTFFGRAGAGARQFFTGDGSAAATSRDINSLKARKSAFDEVKKRMSGEMVKKDWTYGSIGKNARDVNGAEIKGKDGEFARFNYKDFMAQYSSAQSQNLADFEIVDSYGDTHRISLATAEKEKGFILKNNEDFYIRNAVNDEVKLDNGTVVSSGVRDSELIDLIKDARAKGAVISDRDSVTTNGSEKLGQEIRAKERSNMINQANDRYSGGKK